MTKSVVYAIGVFDLFHRGHVEFLKKARSLGDRLVVAVNADNMVAEYKRRPVFSQDDRLELVRACRFVDYAFVIETFDNKKAVLENHVTCIVHGDDWSGQSYLAQIRLTQDFLDEHCIEIRFIPYWRGISTSQILTNANFSPKSA
jgi:glycerol-3-phosphate cytidylyltransferase